MFQKSLLAVGLLSLCLLTARPAITVAQDEGLPAIAREVYRPHTELPPTPRVVTERLVTEPQSCRRRWSMTRQRPQPRSLRPAA